MPFKAEALQAYTTAEFLIDVYDGVDEHSLMRNVWTDVSLRTGGLKLYLDICVC